MKSKKTKHKREELTKAELHPQNMKARINTMVDLDVLDWLRSEAQKLGVGYQTLLNMKLREAKGGSADERIRAIVRDELKKKGA